jgi:hypothetical protein
VEKKSCERREKWAMNFLLILQNTYIFYTTKIGESRIITNPSMTPRMMIHETMIKLYNIEIYHKTIPCNGKSMGKAMGKSISKAMCKSMSAIMTK